MLACVGSTYSVIVVTDAATRRAARAGSDEPIRSKVAPELTSPARLSAHETSRVDGTRFGRQQFLHQFSRKQLTSRHLTDAAGEDHRLVPIPEQGGHHCP